LPQNPLNKNKMENNNLVPAKRKFNKATPKPPRKRFTAVDVWQTKFGPVSERAVYDLYSQRFNIELHNMKKYSFPQCVKALRELNDPTLGTPPTDNN
tara:strand:- start:4 stop:294 length:291 start_codon:yes stop_codon:yes gene_type:complete